MPPGFLPALLLVAACGREAGAAPDGAAQGAADPCPSDIHLVYSPLLPLAGEDAEISVTVEDPDGVSQVALALTAWSLADGDFDRLMAPDATPGRSGALGCASDSPPGASARTFTCAAPLSELFDGPMLVRVGVTVDDGCGAHQPTERRWEFAAGLSGDPAGGVRWGVPALEGAPIPALRRPGDPVERLDLGVVDTSDRFPGDRVASLRAMMTDSLVRQFFGGRALYGGRALWSFYLLPGASPDSCRPGAVPVGAPGLDAGIDLRLALCPGLDGSVSALPGAEDTAGALRAVYVDGAGASIQALVPRGTPAGHALRHELGHAAFYLSDEYGRVNGGRIFDTWGPAGGACDAAPATWFNNVVGLDACQWYWRCFQAAGGLCQPGEWEPDSGPRLVETGEGCAMARTHGRGEAASADYGHSCERRAWRIYEAITGAAPLSLVCQYGGLPGGCEPIEDCTRRARLGASLAATTPSPGALDSLRIRFRGGVAVAASRQVVRGYARTLPIAGHAAELVAWRGEEAIASAPLGAFWQAHMEADGRRDVVVLQDFELAVTLPLAAPGAAPDRYTLLPLGADGARGEPLLRLRVAPTGALAIEAAGPLPKTQALN